MHTLTFTNDKDLLTGNVDLEDRLRLANNGVHTYTINRFRVGDEVSFDNQSGTVLYTVVSKDDNFLHRTSTLRFWSGRRVYQLRRIHDLLADPLYVVQLEDGNVILTTGNYLNEVK